MILTLRTHLTNPNDLLTAGWNQTPRGQPCEHVHAPPPHLQPLASGPHTQKTRSRARPTSQGDCLNIGSRARSVPIPSPPVSSLGFPPPLYIPAIWGAIPRFSIAAAGSLLPTATGRARR
jgi:hypothetical protein